MMLFALLVMWSTNFIVGDARRESIVGDARCEFIVGDMKREFIVGDMRRELIDGDVWALPDYRSELLYCIIKWYWKLI